MTPQLQTQPPLTKQPKKILYPDSYGQPMSDNTLKFAALLRKEYDLPPKFRVGAIHELPLLSHFRDCLR